MYACIRLTACLPDFLDLTCCLSILLWTCACEAAGSRDLAFVGAVEISSLRLITITNAER